MVYLAGSVDVPASRISFHVKVIYFMLPGPIIQIKALAKQFSHSSV